MQAATQTPQALSPVSALPAMPAALDDVRWAEIIRKLRAPFAPWEIYFRVQKGEILAYVKRSAVVRRLNQVVGAGNWTFDPEVLLQDEKAVRVVKGYLTIYGVTKASFGDAGGEIEPSKTADSDSLKRVGMVFEIGAHLECLSFERVQPSIRPNGGNIAWRDVLRLRDLYGAGKLWESREVAEYYGATFALDNGEGVDERETRGETRDETHDALDVAALDDASAFIDEIESDPYEQRAQTAMKLAREAGAQQAQIDWMLGVAKGDAERLDKALGSVLEALAKRRAAPRQHAQQTRELAGASTH